MSGNVRFNLMHFMPYVHLPENQKDFPSLWVDFPNKFYDPERGYKLNGHENSLRRRHQSRPSSESSSARPTPESACHLP